MQIKVASTKVLKKGTGDYGEWKLVKVVTEDTEYTTFADGAEKLTSGSIIDITDLNEDDQNRKSFKKYEVISGGQVSKSPETNGMTPDLWAEKDRLERFSIESQVAFKGIVELAKSPPTEWKLHKVSMEERFAVVYNAALDWALVHFKPTKEAKPTPPQPETKPTVTEVKEELFPKKYKDAGEFAKACSENLSLSTSDICSKMGVSKITDIADLDAAYKTLSGN